MDFRRTGSRQRKAAFTLIELLVVISIIAVLAGILLPIFGRTKQQANVILTMSNMKQLGIAMLSYANDNNECLPNRATNSSTPGQSSKWPTLLRPYLQDTRVYSSPIPDVGGKTYKVTDPTQYFVDGANYSSYIYNGMNELNAYNNPAVTLRLNTVSTPTQTILLGIPLPQQGSSTWISARDRQQQRCPQQSGVPERVGVHVLRRLIAVARQHHQRIRQPPEAGELRDLHRLALAGGQVEDRCHPAAAALMRRAPCGHGHFIRDAHFHRSNLRHARVAPAGGSRGFAWDRTGSSTPAMSAGWRFFTQLGAQRAGGCGAWQYRP